MKILQSIRFNRRSFRAGQEQELAPLLTPELEKSLTQRGLIEGERNTVEPEAAAPSGGVLGESASADTVAKKAPKK